MSDRPSVPQEVRERLFEESDNRCQTCGRKGKRDGGDVELQLHHKVHRKDGGTNDPKNLLVMCHLCHNHLHSRKDEDDIKTNLNGDDHSPTSADYKIINALETIGAATTGEVAEEATLSAEHTRRRLYALAAVDVVARNAEGQWDVAERVEESISGRLPDRPEQAARFARDDVIRKMRDNGMSHSEIAEIVQLDERTIPVAINRARAFDPPVPPVSSSEPDLEELAQRVAVLERQFTDSS